jgi:hypothetical protein
MLVQSVNAVSRSKFHALSNGALGLPVSLPVYFHVYIVFRHTVKTIASLEIAFEQYILV